jgi:hypothetical protein
MSPRRHHVELISVHAGKEGGRPVLPDFLEAVENA